MDKSIAQVVAVIHSPCDVTDGEWGCVLSLDHGGPHRNSEGICIGPWVACYVPSGQMMYEVIHEWLAENMPRALELCPYKAVRDYGAEDEHRHDCDGEIPCSCETGSYDADLPACF